MAWVFELAAECGPERFAAHQFAEFFRGQSWYLTDDLLSQCSTNIHQDGEGNWWSCVLPSGLSRSGIHDDIDAILMTEAGRHLYERLRIAPPFRYALVGVESDDFRAFSELDDDLVTLAFDGLVIAEEIWTSLDRPAVFVPFKPGYFWRPYKGEIYGKRSAKL